MCMVEHSRKIAFSGTSCVGKTTLYEGYKSRYESNPRYTFVEEAARIYFTRNSQIPVSERFSFEPQSEIQDLAIEQEKRAHQTRAKVIMCDRSVLDAPAYGATGI